MTVNHVVVRNVTPDDATAIHELAATLGLELGSQKMYDIWCQDFRRWSVVATDTEGKIIGFLTSYPRPDHPEHLLVWQMGIKAEASTHTGTRLVKYLHERIAFSVLEYIPDALGIASVSTLIDFAGEFGDAAVTSTPETVGGHRVVTIEL